jgi:hypothetical protein
VKPTTESPKSLAIAGIFIHELRNTNIEALPIKKYTEKNTFRPYRAEITPPTRVPKIPPEMSVQSPIQARTYVEAKTGDQFVCVL